jgi:predicted ATPase/DNA-binding CsgD family transcriptional regulator
VRLLTLVGPGGIGKTRLALEVSNRHASDERCAVDWVELTPVAEPTDVARAVAVAIGLQERPGQSLIQTLVEGLRQSPDAPPRLIVLDNCEHVLEACAQLAETLLHACAELRLLTTSREALGVRGETTWLVPPLSLPDGRLPASVLTLAKSEAVRLFVTRAGAAQRGFTLTANNAPLLAEVCRRLDGIPLALELAASRVAALSLEQLSARLDDRFRVLVQRGRTGPSRQQTLLATVEWSYSLLTQGEQSVFEALCTFGDGWTLEAAEAVCTTDSANDGHVVDLLARLVAKSMVVAEPLADGTAMRYRMLETLRAYGKDRLAARPGIEDQIRNLQAKFFLDLAERAAAELWGPNERIWLTRLDSEHDNLRNALDWCLERNPDLGLRLVQTLWGFWLLRGYLVEGDRRMQAALARVPPATPARAVALVRAARLALRMAGQERGRRWLEESRLLFRATGDIAECITVMHDLGALAALQGRYGDAQALFDEGMSHAALPEQCAAFRHSLGVLSYLQGEFDMARRFLEDSLRLFDEMEPSTPLMPTLLNMASWSARPLGGALHLVWEGTLLEFRNLRAAGGRAYALANLGTLADASGEPNRAYMLLQESLESFQRDNDRHGVARVLGQLGNLSVRRGEYTSARRFLDDSLKLRHELGDGRGIGSAILGLARLAVDERDLRRARHLYAQAVDHFSQMGDRPGECAVLLDTARVAQLQGDAHRCEALLVDTLNVRQQLGADFALARGTALGPGFNSELLGAARLCLPDAPNSTEMLFRQIYALGLRWSGPAGLLLAFEDMADAAGSRGDYSRSACLHGFAARLGGRRFPAARQLLAGDWGATESANIRAAWERGRTLSTERALAHALLGTAVLPTTGSSRRPRKRIAASGLTERELEVLGLVADGLTNREIGTRLVVSERTVAKHIDNIFRKTGATSRTAAAAVAMRSGLV